MTNKELRELFNKETGLSAFIDIEIYHEWLEKKVIDYNTALREAIVLHNRIAFNIRIPQLCKWTDKWTKLLRTK